jgi:hypothetical protein
MSLSETVRRIALLAFACLTAACGDRGATEPETPIPAGSPSFVHLEGDPGESIASGESFSYTQADAFFTARGFGGQLEIEIAGDESWRGWFEMPDSLDRLTPGEYTNLTRFPFHDPSAGGLSWIGRGAGCNTLTGSFTIDSVTYLRNQLISIALRFAQHCEGRPEALRGSIYLNAADTTSPPGPADPPPSDLWRPPAGSTPATGNYVYLASDPGDYIGQGDTLLYTHANSTISASAIGAMGYVLAGPWSGSFHPMHTIPRLQPGYYPLLQRYPFHNPARGGLSWHGDGRGCNRLRGWFVVDRVSYEDDLLTSLEVRFEQQCEESMPPLRGAIRWN